MKQLTFLFLLCSLGRPADAQTADRTRARDILHAVAARYAAQPNLSFSVAYRYTTEEKPGVYLDSLKGSFELSGDQYRYVLAGTEFIGSKTISLTLFKEDKLILLARPPANPVMSNPLSLMDSLIASKDSLACQLEETPRQQQLTFLFPPGKKSIKRMEYRIDRNSGMVTRMIYTIDARMLYDPSVQSLVKGGPSYVNVEMELSDYHTGAVTGGTLDIAHYVKKEGGQYVAVAPYELYKIFLATPDL